MGGIYVIDLIARLESFIHSFIHWFLLGFSCGYIAAETE